MVTVPKPLDRRIRNREHDAKRRQQHQYRAWYNSPRWRAIRAAQLTAKPLCERCQSGGRVVAATVCHHTVAHKGDADLFWNGPFASSCKDCHDVDEQRIERGGKPRCDVGDDGWPVGT
jgi:5-methylcytosine-specific restriction protein A